MQPFVLPSFQGPIDLLVLLIQKEELDIFGFPIQEVIRQYLARQEKNVLDDEITIVRDIASLVQFKTEKLLPPEAKETQEPEEEPPSEFLQHLIQYAAFKHVALELAKKEERETSFFTRGTEEELPEATPTTSPISLQEFANAFGRVLKEAERKKLFIGKESWTVEDKIKLIKEITKKESILFTTLFTSEKPKEELIVTFLAVLELLKQERIKITPDEQHTFIISGNIA